MIYIIMGLSLLFMATGFIITEKNAQYLLSGYNMMKQEERQKVDIKAYIAYFSKFHIVLGVSFFLFGITLTYVVSENAGGIFLVVYPILAYIYFLKTSVKYSLGMSTRGSKVGMIVLAVTLLFVLGLLGYGFRENALTIETDSIQISGNYGEALSPSDIHSIELVGQLPDITFKTNGFALGSVKKGYFKTREGEIVKLILNSDHMPAILITKTDGKKVYYSAKNQMNVALLDEMKNTLPQIMIKY
jgi:hypothetical protein